ncbi:MAG: reverse transcriptase domain-containing protein, partial [Chitinophagales bacterium]
MEQLKINLFNAYYEARKNKRNTYNQLRFEINYEQELFQLYQEIIDKTYTIDKSIAFIIDKPVKREIFAASFKDRVIHHLIFNYINPLLEKQFIEDSYSCRVGKGTLFGIKRAENFMKQCSENFTQDCYVLKLDIQGYFMSIDKHLLKNKLVCMLSEHEFNTQICHNTTNKPEQDLSYSTLWWLIDLVVFNDSTKDCIIKGKLSDWKNLPLSKSLFYSQPYCGLPIGNLTSQLFSNVYLYSFDKWIKTHCTIKYYGRYVDDFFIIDNNKEYLIYLLAEIKNYLLSNDKLIIHPKKIYLQQYSKG